MTFVWSFCSADYVSSVLDDDDDDDDSTIAPLGSAGISAISQ